ncbi:MAG: hypothetical protein KY468_16325, partial [Armatimonadetes bacterium]|nr:hypothetical protein [Armatimonadota bacterium]
LSLISFTQQLWVPEAKGWRMHLPLSFEQLARPSASPHAARVIWQAAQRLPDGDPLRKSAMEQAETVIRNALAGDDPIGMDALEAAKAIGLSTEPLLPRARRGLDAILKAQDIDGSWRFHPDEAHAVLGEKGGTAVGLIAGNAAALLRYAELSGDAAVREAGLRAVRFMETLPRPEGSQVWEVPLHVPDILAAGHGVRAYLAAYRVTKDPHWRDQAVRSAKSGLPFLYTWSAPRRPVMRYGSVPVYGTSWHVLPWYGLLVQWNGLAYAAELPDLARVDDSLPWRQIAEGVTACGIRQQQKEGEPMYGLYTDAWSVLTDSVPFPVPYIAPHLLLECLNALAE